MVYAGRTELIDPNKARYARDARRGCSRDHAEANIFLGLSAGKVVKPEMLKQMAPKPLILALANPEPEIQPDVARKRGRMR